MTEPKRDAAMELANEICGMKIHGSAFLTGEPMPLDTQDIMRARITALIRPHLAPRPVVPEEVERVAKELDRWRDAISQPMLQLEQRIGSQDSPLRQYVERLHQASTLLRALAGRNAGLKAALADAEETIREALHQSNEGHVKKVLLAYREQPK